MRAYPTSALWAFPPLLILLSACVTAQPVVIQAPPTAQDMSAQPPAPPDDDAGMTPIDQLMAPIALYPDPLVSLILPAATYPDQVQQASSFLLGGGSPDQVGGMGWDPSVQGLAHYPPVIEWMAANDQWTAQLGGAFASQPADVMDAIQDLRRRAQAAGTLVTNPQQQVVVDQDTVEILPEQPQMIYVPQYDPAVVYAEQAPGFDAQPLFGWGQPYPAGVWLSFDFDWHSHAVWQGDWYDYRMQHGGWSRPVDFAQFHGNVRINNRSYAGWRAPRNAPPPPPQMTQHRGSAAGAQAKFAQPHVMTGAPRPPANAAHVNSLMVSRGEHPAASKAPVITVNPPETRTRPTQPGSVAAQPRTPGTVGEGSLQRAQPQSPAEGERKPTIEPRREVPLPESTPPATHRAVEPALERTPGVKPTSEPVRESAPARVTPETLKPKATPNPKEPAQKTKEQRERETQPQDVPPK
jgi:hypothetical protein